MQEFINFVNKNPPVQTIPQFTARGTNRNLAYEKALQEQHTQDLYTKMQNKKGKFATKDQADKFIDKELQNIAEQQILLEDNIQRFSTDIGKDV